MTETNSTIHIPMFDGDRSSFPLCKTKLLMMLDTRDVEPYATGSISTLGERKPLLLSIGEHLSKSKKTKSLICLCLSDDILASVIELETAHDVFVELCFQYENNGRGTRIRGWSQFWSIFNGTETIRAYIAKITSAANILTTCGGHIDTQTIIDKLFAGLPSEYDSI